MLTYPQLIGKEEAELCIEGKTLMNEIFEKNSGAGGALPDYLCQVKYEIRDN